MKKALLIAAAVIVLVPAALVLLGIVLGHERTRTHTVSGAVRAIVVKSDAGNVRLIRAGGPVHVRETQHYVLQKPRLEQDLTGGVLTLETDCDGFFFNCSSDLRVTVPAGVEVSIDADSGDVHADGIDVREIRAQTDSGDVDIDRAIVRNDRAARSIDARTDSGDVTLDGG